MATPTITLRLNQLDIEEIQAMDDPQEIKDFLTCVMLATDSSLLEGMNRTYTNQKLLH